jgi:hypothetical protein
MREKPALAHAQLLGKRTHRKAFQALDGSDIHGSRKDSFPRAQPPGLLARHSLFS